MAFEDTPGVPGNNTPDGTADGTPEGAMGSSPEGTPESSPAASAQPVERREVTVRRAPKYVPFLILGGLVGVAVAAIVAFTLPGDASYDRNSVFGFFMILFGGGGVILGAITALLLDRLSVRRAQHAVVEAVPEAEAGGVPEDGTGTGTQANGQS